MSASTHMHTFLFASWYHHFMYYLIVCHRSCPSISLLHIFLFFLIRRFFHSSFTIIFFARSFQRCLPLLGANGTNRYRKSGESLMIPPTSQDFVGFSESLEFNVLKGHMWNWNFGRWQLTSCRRISFVRHIDTAYATLPNLSIWRELVENNK